MFQTVDMPGYLLEKNSTSELCEDFILNIEMNRHVSYACSQVLDRIPHMLEFNAAEHRIKKHETLSSQR